MITLEEVAKAHPKKINFDLIEHFNVRTIKYFAKDAEANSGIVTKHHDNPLVFALILGDLIEKEYLIPFRDILTTVMKKFDDAGIVCRLYDIPRTMHAFGRIKLMWYLNSHEYAMELRFNTSGDNTLFSGFYILTKKHDCAPNDPDATLKTDMQEFDDNVALPDWFISGLGLNS